MPSAFESAALETQLSAEYQQVCLAAWQASRADMFRFPLRHDGATGLDEILARDYVAINGAHQRLRETCTKVLGALEHARLADSAAHSALDPVRAKSRLSLAVAASANPWPLMRALAASETAPAQTRHAAACLSRILLLSVRLDRLLQGLTSEPSEDAYAALSRALPTLISSISLDAYDLIRAQQHLTTGQAGHRYPRASTAPTGLAKVS